MVREARCELLVVLDLPGTIHPVILNEDRVARVLEYLAI